MCSKAQYIHSFSQLVIEQTTPCVSLHHHVCIRISIKAHRIIGFAGKDEVHTCTFTPPSVMCWINNISHMAIIRHTMWRACRRFASFMRLLLDRKTSFYQQICVTSYCGPPISSDDVHSGWATMSKRIENERSIWQYTFSSCFVLIPFTTP